jgi:hypothetical protein
VRESISASSSPDSRAVRSGDDRVSAQNLDIVILERLLIQPAEARDFGQHVVAQRRPIELRVPELPAEAARVLQVLREVRAVDEQLLRHATADHTGAADAVLFDNSNPGAVAGRNARSAHPAGSGADHQQVIGGSSTHAPPTLPKCVHSVNRKADQMARCGLRHSGAVPVRSV